MTNIVKANLCALTIGLCGCLGSGTLMPSTDAGAGTDGATPADGAPGTDGELPNDAHVEQCDEAGYRSALLARRTGWGRAAGDGSLTWDSVVVTNTARSGEGSLKAALERSEPAWITFAPAVQGKTIDLGSVSNVIDIRSNKVLDGRGTAVTVEGAGLYITEGKKNIVLHNVCVEDIGAASAQSGDGIRVSSSTDIWIDHVTVQRANDGALDVTTYPGRVDRTIRVTIGYSRIGRTGKNVLLAATPNDPDQWAQKPSGDQSDLIWVSFYRNYLNSSFARNPLMRGVSAHLWNNWVEDFGDSGRGQGFVVGDYPSQSGSARFGKPIWGARLKIENNVIGSTEDDSGLISAGGPESNELSIVDESGTVLQGTAEDQLPDRLRGPLPSSFTDALSYPYQVEPTSNHPQWKAQAGCRDTADREAILAACR